ncbi:MAG: pyridoxamine 5'-phosphate oxidase [Proteobacteria bacterium]|nr:pyridoxamine 5'-phosphate oxidase [Pseudomonadota bacterium]MBU1139787.1 pyridoxamine 5'-phosphate oxidase [Pseudomonadota bacterium]MBU1234094.1 pyridoxamine 5'-phosphate oxidase [Pseudomonadota bacterium]MBU1418472.1 pyridoxamine 5'-phosphate oxidase [Pseudomonadota bacterium]MBU1453838.1 pyridoxamine 5'-phosphate oxidase [Pseudomonadota bacterium]
MDIGHFRREYLKSGLEHSDLLGDPVEQFSLWFNQANATDIPDPNAMVLATVGGDGQPSQRTVLLKYYDENGFVFFTNQKSRKAREIAGNPKVNLHFVWLELERQISVAGIATPITSAESARYFMTRPRESQIAAWVSNQSSRISSRQLLMQAFQEMKQKFANGDVPLPSFWGGYRVNPSSVEFWQGRRNRLHDRFLYTRSDSAWEIERLAP